MDSASPTTPLALAAELVEDVVTVVVVVLEDSVVDCGVVWTVAALALSSSLTVTGVGWTTGAGTAGLEVACVVVGFVSDFSYKFKNQKLYCLIQ